MKVLIITEANEKVASGHLMESISLAQKLEEKKFFYVLMVNSDIPDVWKEKLQGLNYREYERSLDYGMDEINNAILSDDFNVVITDVRAITNEQIIEIRKVFSKRIICLDEWGNRFLECDVIVNNMLDITFWNYLDSPAKVYAGPQYLMLSDKLIEYHNREKKIAPRIKNVVISMGGVDPKNNTKVIVNILRRIQEIEEINVVLGGGYIYKEELLNITETDMRFKIHQNINYIYDLFEEADLAFCAGGNTMYELASIGTPMVVIPTMPHEEKNGKAFEQAGACMVVYELIPQLVLDLQFDNRVEMSHKGKNLIDGMGLERIIALISDSIC